MKLVFIVSVLLGLIGNGLYISSASPLQQSDQKYTDSTTAQVLLGLGRFIAGAAGANAAIVLSYLTIVSKPSERLESMNRYRTVVFVGKMCGPRMTCATPSDFDRRAASPRSLDD